ncbi:uncharacterized protein LOC135219699 [Macrobrachium nipponense]|uniref:uncharacterized protein LOC135219699 n=1 Tax=Macrobrachium nipponense TaxID=159736 RepID=UPI0030C821E1
MRVRSALLLLGCLGGALAALPTKDSQAKDSSKVLLKRDDQHHHAHTAPALPPTGDSYSSYTPTAGASAPAASGGHYYYYHPVEEPKPAAMEDDQKKDYCPVDTVLAPIIVITVFAGVLAGNALGMIPRVRFQLPQATINAINALKPDPLGIKPDIIGPANAFIPADGTGRRLMTDDGPDLMGNATQMALDQITTFVLDTIETDDCGSRFICEAGKYADGRKKFLGLMHFMTPPIYRNKIKVFKDSALKKSDCRKFKCGYTDGKKI